MQGRYAIRHRPFLVPQEHIEFQRNISSAKHISSFALAKHIENPIGIYILHLIRQLSLPPSPQGEGCGVRHLFSACCIYTSSDLLRKPPVSLRLGHGLALTVHRTVIHYQSAAKATSRRQKLFFILVSVSYL